MGKRLCPDRQRATLAILACVISLLVPGAFGQVGVIVGGALLGWLWLRSEEALPSRPFPVQLGRRTGLCLLLAFVALLFTLPLLAQVTQDPGVKLFDRFFRAGALVFGGGHVVLPVLQAEVVPTGLVTNDAFLAGYGFAQAVPGPLFTFAAYLGAICQSGPNGWAGALIALLGIFLPGYLLIVGFLPLWDQARRHPAASRAMPGINAAVVGLLLAALYSPVWTSAIRSAADFGLAIVSFLMLDVWKVPPWLVVLACVGAAVVAAP
jgi:chromate transporter